MKSLHRIFLIAAVILMAFSWPKKEKVTLWMIGDSTMANKEVRAYPETGWGTPFSYFFDSTVKVENRAKNGRSTRTFLSEQLWRSVQENLEEGDYVFIQFGHNDESKEKPDRYTTPEQYMENLVLFVKETRERKAIPVLLTPVTRRRFDSSGQILYTHGVYPGLVKRVARSFNVPMIDMDEKSRELLQRFGKDNSKWLFLQLEKGEHPNYPEGKNDNTHFNELGARLIAQIVLQEVKTLDLELAQRIRTPEVKK